LTTGLSYYFIVYATNAVGNSHSSNQSEAMIAAVVPSVPTSFSKLSATRDTISVKWAIPADNGGTPLTGYKVYGNLGGSDTVFSYLD